LQAAARPATARTAGMAVAAAVKQQAPAAAGKGKEAAATTQDAWRDPKWAQHKVRARSQ
jgi:hypothetical protein